MPLGKLYLDKSAGVCYLKKEKETEEESQRRTITTLNLTSE
jgi:hypothetical protein